MKAGRRPPSTGQAASPWSRPVAEFASGQVPSKAICPYCGTLTDGWTDPELGEGRKPKPGDGGVCLYCGAVAIYTETLSLRRPDEIEQVIYSADPKVRHAQRAQRIFIERNPKYRREPKP